MVVSEKEKKRISEVAKQITALQEKILKIIQECSATHPINLVRLNNLYREMDKLMFDFEVNIEN